jgi:hypothetical protein
MSDTTEAVFQYGRGVGEDFWGAPFGFGNNPFSSRGGRQTGVTYPGKLNKKKEPFTGSWRDAPGGMRLAEGAGFGGEEKGWDGGIAGFSEAKIGWRKSEISVWRLCWGRIFNQIGNLGKFVAHWIGAFDHDVGTPVCNLEDFHIVRYSIYLNRLICFQRGL